MNTPEMSAWYTLTLKRLTHQTQNICNHTSDPLITQQKTNSWMDCHNLLFIELPPGGKNIAKGGLAKPFAQVSPCKLGIKNVLGSWKCLIQREKQNQSNRKKIPLCGSNLPCYIHFWILTLLKETVFFTYRAVEKNTAYSWYMCLCFSPQYDFSSKVFVWMLCFWISTFPPAPK